MAGLDKADYDREYGDRELVSRILHYFKPYRMQVTFIGIAISLASLAGAVTPIILASILDQLRNNVALQVIINLIILVLVISVLQFILNAIQQELTFKAVENAVFDLRGEVFGALLKRDMSFLDENPTGKIASRTVNDTNDYGQVVSLTANLLGQILVVVFILYFLFDSSVKLTLMIILFAPLVVITALSFRKIARTVSRESQQVLAKVNALIQESTSGIYVTKSFRAEQKIYDEFEGLNRTSYSVNWKRGAIFGSIFPILTLISGIGTAMIVYFGGIDVLQVETTLGNLVAWLPGGQLTIGQWFLFLQGLNLFMFPLVSIASFWSQFQQGLSASERIFSLIDAENEVVQIGKDIIEEPKGEIEFENLTFGYNEEITVLKDFNLHIKPGEIIGLVGHTGAGKSSIIKLISRYYEYQDGMLSIDGKDIRTLDIEQYRKHLSVISQDVFLWNDTIRANILYGVDHPEEYEGSLSEVLESVEAMDWIQKMDKGLDTVIGERGASLSMGQRQLLAFARILLRNPSIMILDEATSSIDPLTEVKIQRAINRVMEGRTAIIVAHRLSTIKNCDRIIVLKDGKIIDQGTHDELMDRGEHYAELYNTYFRHQSLEYVESIEKLVEK